MIKEYIYVANWKMYWSFNETIEYATKYYNDLLTLAGTPGVKIVLCPSAPAMYPLAQMFQETSIAIGAQDCSEHQTGSFTGQVSAQHLYAAGSTFCIIGHSERRQRNAETSTDIAKKLEQLLAVQIIPIICIGETEEQCKGGQSLKILEQQLAPVTEVLMQNAHRLTPNPILIAYEPTWSIGTNTLAPQEHLETIFAWLSTQAFKKIPNMPKKLIYGGSTDAQNIALLRRIGFIDGFLIGRASLNFKEFEKIVKSSITEGL